MNHIKPYILRYAIALLAYPLVNLCMNWLLVTDGTSAHYASLVNYIGNLMLAGVIAYDMARQHSFSLLLFLCTIFTGPFGVAIFLLSEYPNGNLRREMRSASAIYMALMILNTIPELLYLITNGDFITPPAVGYGIRGLILVLSIIALSRNYCTSPWIYLCIICLTLLQPWIGITFMMLYVALRKSNADKIQQKYLRYICLFTIYLALFHVIPHLGLISNAEMGSGIIRIIQIIAALTMLILAYTDIPKKVSTLQLGIILTTIITNGMLCAISALALYASEEGYSIPISSNPEQQ